MQDHERGVELNRKRSRDRRHFDADRFDIIADLDREGRASDPEIPRELTHPGFYSVRGHDQVIDQGPAPSGVTLASSSARFGVKRSWHARVSTAP